MKKTIIIGSLLLTQACALIVDGTDQKIAINSTPQGADCALIRNGDKLGSVITPGNITVEKTRHGIDIACSKAGYKTANYHNQSGWDWWIVGNAVILTPTGFIADAAAGADNKYTSPVDIELVK